MNLADIEQAVEDLRTDQGPEFIYDLLTAYGFPKASITRLRDGAYDRLSDDESAVLWRNRVHYQRLDEEVDPHAAIDAAHSDPAVLRANPRFLIVHSNSRFLAIDTKTSSTLDIEPGELKANAAFFLPWAGLEKAQHDNVNPADVKAAEKMAELYVEITKHNDFSTAEEVQALNVFFSRLLFCYFAEDTGIFPDSAFTNAVGSLTQADGSDTNTFLDSLFTVLDTERAERTDLPTHFDPFDWVNGSLFDTDSPAPRFTAKARTVLLDLGSQNWAKINPDIFGSMIQAVVQPDQREGLGMHYTSVENILRVLRPLFLDELSEAIEAASTVAALQKQLDRLARIKVFDPACGSGNFLIIAYKELRRLEHEVLVRMVELEPVMRQAFAMSVIKLENFYGIEIDDFAHEVAILSLWLAKHQMNRKFHELFGTEIPLIPLKDAGSIVRGNATRMKWSETCLPDADTFVCGNPPYRGSRNQTPEQKDDLRSFFGSTSYPQRLNYVALWFLAGAEYLNAGAARLGFISTNAVSLGEHVSLLWPRIYSKGIDICFAHDSFPWRNSAKQQANVHCVVVGLSKGNPPKRRYYSDQGVSVVGHISPYLRPINSKTIAAPASKPINGLPPMRNGSAARDGGHLMLDSAAKDSLLRAAPEAQKFIKRFVGSEEFLNGKDRYCLWIEDDQVDEAWSIPEIAERLDAVRLNRLAGGKSKKSVADTPHRFGHRAHSGKPSIVVLSATADGRDYLPIGFQGGDIVVSNGAFEIDNGGLGLFGVLQSRMHTCWVRLVCARLNNDPQFGVQLGYNAFPMPSRSPQENEEISGYATEVLRVREAHSEKTLAQLYKPSDMPHELRRAHHQLDQSVEQLFQSKPFPSDTERMSTLLDHYCDLVAGH